MRQYWKYFPVFVALFLIASNTNALPELHQKKQNPFDLEVSGALAGMPPESTRYVTREELLALPQVSFTVSGDTNFTFPTKIRGVQLEELARAFGASPASDMVVAICDDKYRANYPQSYMLAHHPVLVLEVNGKPPAGWPKDSEEHKFNMGPYMISNPKFQPSYKVLSHSDEAQIPWGVVRIEFREEKLVFGAIDPRGPHSQDHEVKDGFRIAQQNCFRCHNSGHEGGQKSGLSWEVLAAFAEASPQNFADYVRAPRSKNPQAQMPGNPQYDDETLAALAAYFRTFSGQPRP
jgi:mono/diheme cytochrome c family protein